MNTDLPASPDAPMTLSPSPLSANGLFQLFFQPRKFFLDTPRLARRFELMVAVYLVGIMGAIDKVDQRLLDAAVKGDALPNDDFMAMLLHSWPSYWGVVLGGGILAAAIAWLIGGWFYGTRVSWSGATDMDPTLARRVWAWQSLVTALPMTLLAVAQTLLYSNYEAAWRADDMVGGLLVMVAIVWSCAVSYVGVTTVFTLKRGRAVFWFLIAPITFYLVIAFGAGLMAYNNATGG